MSQIDEGRKQSLEDENRQLREHIRRLEEQLAMNGQSVEEKPVEKPVVTEQADPQTKAHYLYDELNKELTNEQIARYSRHLLLPEISVKRQAKLCNGSVLLVGAGGLGSPAALYLAAAGVGKIGLVDFDVVDSSNLHRQIIHNEYRTGMLKTLSAKTSCMLMNHKANVECYNTPFTELNGLELVKQYDVIMDCSDNVTTRYMVNDACVLAGKPLVSGSAVRFEGQLTIYNYRKNGVSGPCYRCMHPHPPPPETVTSCSDGGVLGIVPGIIGCLQALEVQKLLMEMDDEESVSKHHCELLVQKMLIFNAKTCSFKTLKIRGRQATCKVCGDHPTITDLKPEGQSLVCLDKISVNPSDALKPENRITSKEYEGLLIKGEESHHLLLDVRENVQYKIGAIPHSMNIPAKQMDKQETIEAIKEEIKKRDPTADVTTYPIFVMCRRGIASVRATKALLDKGFSNVKNIDGGVNSWRNQVDNDFPLY